ncbi:MAG: ribulokinase [Armatimonadota bacterium]|nr:ribulokinase [Armatimonadota bacterium]
MPRHAIGLDFGTSSARALLVDVETAETASAEHEYLRGTLDGNSPTVSRQDADDYLDAAKSLLSWAARQCSSVVGIGVAATASTPIPVDGQSGPLSRRYPDNPDAYAWLWKDHSSQEEADEITHFFAKNDPTRLARVGAYYAEWFWAKALRCARRSPAVFDVAATWLEQGDFITAALTGTVVRGAGAAGHKGLCFNGYPTDDLLANLDPRLGVLRRSMGQKVVSSSEVCGRLTEEWAQRTGIAAGTPVAAAGIDAHVGAVGAGVCEDRLCMVLGTSACHIAVAPYTLGLESVAGISGIADDSVLPGMFGLEAGQAAFGDLLEWAARTSGVSQEELTRAAEALPAGSNGTLVVDFHSGNRCPYADANLSGAVMGLTLKSTTSETYRACVESLAMGIRQIVGLFEASGIRFVDLIACGGVADKNPFALQTIADVTGKEVFRSLSDQTCALGAAIFGAVAGGAFGSAEEGQAALCRLAANPVEPEPKRHARYNDLFPIYLDAQRLMAVETDLAKRLEAFRGRPC